ncbi:MAG: SDR family NAD(P)-dependent oxidoreductase [Ferruginibacter sp.]
MKQIVALLYIVFCFFCVQAQPVNDDLLNNSPDFFLATPPESSLSGNNDKKILVNEKDSSAYALIAGGSRGIGFAIAEALAKRRYNLILIARGMDDLVEAKRKLETAYPAVHVEILSYDLSKEETATAIAAWCTEKNIKLKMLCNVAGLGGDEDYLSLSLDSLRYMVRLNLESAMAMSLTLLPLLEKNAASYILNVASMAGFAPIPSKNLYAATKSALISFSYSLRYQLREKNISVSCLAPGPVYTKPSIEKETKRQLGWFGDQMAVSPERVGEITVRKTLKGRPMITPGTLAKILSGVLRILPKRFVTYIYGKAGDRSERKKNK